MIEYFVRHDDYLTLVTAVDDPLYLDEPFVRSTDFKLDPRANARLAEFGGFVNGGDGEGFGASDVFYKCAPTEEIAIERGRVPSFMPGANDSLDMFAKRHGVPLEAALGGSATLYPEYAARLRAHAARAVRLRKRRRAARSAPRRRSAAEPPAATSLHVAGQVWLVAAGGHNVAVQVGAEGVLVVNPGPEEVADAVLAEIAKIAPDKRIRIIVDTNDDAAHVGGNAKLGDRPDAGARSVPRSSRTRTRRCAWRRQGSRIGIRRPTRSSAARASSISTTSRSRSSTRPRRPAMPTCSCSSASPTSSSRADVIEDLTYPVIRTEDGGTVNGTLEALNRHSRPHDRGVASARAARG